MSAPVIQAENLSKTFSRLIRRKSVVSTLRSWASGGSLISRTHVIRDVSFSLHEGERLAVIGDNGVGKTTLLRLLCGIFCPSSGRLEISSRPTALFKCWMDINQDMTIEENARLFSAMLGIPEKETKEREDATLERAGLLAQRGSPLKILSEGQQQRLAFAIFMSSAARFIVLDETLNALDQQFRAVAHDYLDSLRSEGATLIMTSHNLSDLERHCDRALWLENGGVRMDGPIAEVARAYEAARR